MVRELIIESTALTKSYGPHVALDSLDIKIEKGATGLLGIAELVRSFEIVLCIATAHDQFTFSLLFFRLADSSFMNFVS